MQTTTTENPRARYRAHVQLSLALVEASPELSVAEGSIIAQFYTEARRTDHCAAAIVVQRQMEAIFRP